MYILQQRYSWSRLILWCAERRTNIDECRQILKDQLLIILRNGAIRDIPTLDLLSECGDDTIRQFERRIQGIDINVSDMLREEQSLLTSMIKKFPFLQQVSVAEFFLVESFPIHELKKCLPYTPSFKVSSVSRELFWRSKPLPFQNQTSPFFWNTIFNKNSLLICNSAICSTTRCSISTAKYLTPNSQP